MELKSVNKFFVSKLVKEMPASFIAMLKKEKSDKIPLSFNKKKASLYLIQLLHKNGYTIDEICEMTTLRRGVVKQKIKARLTRGINNTFKYLPYEDIKRYCDEMPRNLVVHKSEIKRLLAKELLRSGMETKKVAGAIGISQRSSQRIKREMGL